MNMHGDPEFVGSRGDGGKIASAGSQLFVFQIQIVHTVHETREMLTMHTWSVLLLHSWIVYLLKKILRH